MSEYIYDVVVVGSGFSGALVASSLTEAGLSVLIIEAGQAFEDERPIRQSLRNAFASSDEEEIFAPFADLLAPQWRGYKNEYYASDPNDRLQSQFGAQYIRMVGGAGLAWLGTALRMYPNDFQMGTMFGRGRDWPLSYADLEPWYCEAERELGVAGTFDAELPLDIYRSKPFPMLPIPQSFADRFVGERIQSLVYDGIPLRVASTPQARNSEDGYNGRQLCEGYASCVPFCPVGAKYDPLIHLRRALLSGADLWPETVVTNLGISADGWITSADCRRSDGSAEIVRARVFVLAANGIETPKLLLMSNGQRVDGLANSSGQVGRNLMDHPEKHSCAVLRDEIFPYRGPQSTSGVETLRDGTFRKHRAAFRTALRNDGWRIANGSPFVQSSRALTSSLPDLIQQKRLIGNGLRSRLEFVGRRNFALQSVIEMLPAPENRISLSPDLRDESGLPRPQIRFRLGEYEKEGIAAAAELHAQIFEALACEEDRTFIHLQEDPLEPDAAGSHIMGTTIMGTNPASSVVDPDCRTHDHHNLFIAGSSVFPTGATSNPTLTISALALRLAPTIQSFIQQTLSR